MSSVFSIGNSAKAKADLQVHNVFDGLILGTGELTFLRLALDPGVTSLEKVIRPQQRAQMLRPERRVSAQFRGHRVSMVQPFPDPNVQLDS